MARHSNMSARAMKGFTLIELLVVVAIIALLISILLPSLGKAKRQAAAAACGSNLHQVKLALQMYRDDFNGWMPDSWNPASPFEQKYGSVWSESAWYVPKKNLWFYKLFDRYTAEPDVFVCPGDPLKQTFDFDSQLVDQWDAEKYVNPTDAACGYALNYMFRHAGAMNPDRNGPRWPNRTILMVEVGPDAVSPVEVPLPSTADAGGGLSKPWRDGGRCIWDDGTRPWTTQPTWLTSRHLGRSHFMTLDGSISRVRTVDQLQSDLELWYPDCFGFIPGGTYVCALCKERAPHYNFSGDQLWWWTGAYGE